MANIAIVIYSMYHHIATLAEEVKAGVESTGNKATIYQVAETLPEEVLQKMYAPAKPDYPIATPDILAEADGILFGFPTRFGNLPAQMKAFIDSTGGLWQQGKLYQKPAGAFTSTGTGGGNEMTIVNFLSTLAHQGMIYVPLGYAPAFGELTNLNEVHGGSPWGAGTIAGPDGSRKPSELELKIAKIQGSEFAKVVTKF
jgi:NAD(P)H dehydrogenase (quinone)